MTLLVKIYIPLWFYSNCIIKVSVKIGNVIYIPLWFYSNADYYIKLKADSRIYIPLWFYSNLDVILTIYLRKNLHSTMVLF